MPKVRMKYNGAPKTVKLQSGKVTSEKLELYMASQLQTGDVVEVEDNEKTMYSMKLARCMDGSPAWTQVSNSTPITATFETVTPKAPSRRTSWKARDGAKK